MLALTAPFHCSAHPPSHPGLYKVTVTATNSWTSTTSDEKPDTGLVVGELHFYLVHYGMAAKCPI